MENVNFMQFVTVSKWLFIISGQRCTLFKRIEVNFCVFPAAVAAPQGKFTPKLCAKDSLVFSGIWGRPKQTKWSRTVSESKLDTSAACVANWLLTQEFHYGIGCPCGPCRLIPPAQITHVQSKTNCFRRWAQCCRVGWKVRWFSGFKRMSARAAAGTHGVHKVRHHTIAGVHQRPSHPSTPDVLIWLFISRRTITVIKMLIVFCSFLTCKNNVMMAICIELWGPIGTFKLIDMSILF